MKLWSKGGRVDRLVERYTVGQDRQLDLELARYDVLGTRAHATMLQSVGLLDEGELTDLHRALDELLAEIDRGEFIIDDSFEDVHSKVEYELTERIGEAGKKVHTARSRNDQVLLDLHLWSRAFLQVLRGRLHDLFDQLMSLAERHSDKLMPGYTHMQVAMPSSFGLWFSAYAELLIDDLTMIDAAIRQSDQNPLGSAAGYGSSFPIDRDLTTSELGFERLRINAVGAGLSRGRIEWSTSLAIASVATTLGRFAGDVVLYTGANYGFVSFPDELTTGSSIMPHKKNPDVFELIRSRCNLLRGVPNQISLLQTNLPTGYHRDYQLLKEVIFPAASQMIDSIDLASFMLDQITVSTAWQEDERYHYLYTVEEVNRRVSGGMPFRDAYREVGREVEEGTYAPPDGGMLNHTHVGSIGNLALDRIREKFVAEWERGRLTANDDAP